MTAEAAETWAELEAPYRVALDLAWQSARAGSLGIGAVITDADGTVVATGRNRLMEHEPGEDLLAGTSLAHAEMNALGKLRWRGHEGARLTIWSTLEPCLMCAGSIRLAPIAEVRYLAPDPLFAGVQEARHLNDFIASRWPEVQGPRTDELAVFGLLLPAHVGAFWGALQAGWTEALPAISALAADLARSEELIMASHDGVRVDELVAHLWDRLGEATEDLVKHASVR